MNLRSSLFPNIVGIPPLVGAFLASDTESFTVAIGTAGNLVCCGRVTHEYERIIFSLVNLLLHNYTIFIFQINYSLLAEYLIC